MKKTWDVLIYPECPNMILAYWSDAIREVERAAIDGRHGHLAMGDGATWTAFAAPQEVTDKMRANLTHQCQRRVKYLKSCVDWISTVWTGLNRVAYNVMAFTSPARMLLTLNDGAIVAVQVGRGEIVLAPYAVRKWIADLATQKDRMVFAKWKGEEPDDRDAEP